MVSKQKALGLISLILILTSCSRVEVAPKAQTLNLEVVVNFVDALETTIKYGGGEYACVGEHFDMGVKGVDGTEWFVDTPGFELISWKTTDLKIFDNSGDLLSIADSVTPSLTDIGCQVIFNYSNIPFPSTPVVIKSNGSEWPIAVSEILTQVVKLNGNYARF